jgi:FGGY-family pentulose kinase
LSVVGRLVVGVDVGTGSARAGVFDAGGRMLGRAEHPIALRRPSAGWGEHASGDIWDAVGAAVRSAMAKAGAAPGAVAGIAFDATCSLVLADRAGRPLGASEDGAWDTIAWFDHRARAEAEVCTATGHRVIATCGGAMSPEMQLPKLMWLKRNRPEAWARLGGAFDLADWLAWRATGNPARSLCTLACKWGYLDAGWPGDLHRALGLEDLVARAGLPAGAVAVGADLGPLGAEAAEALGLGARVRVVAGLVDAHAGALGLLGGFAGDAAALERQGALIAGTSTCVMALGREARAMPGVWGPYRSVVLPDRWMVEGGLSASGGLLDHLIARWGGGLDPGPGTHARIAARIAALQAAEGPDLAPGLHVLPDFHGSRSPRADPGAAGVISGLALDASFDGLCRLYWRASVAIALRLREIVAHMAAHGAAHGVAIEALHLAGGHGRSGLLTGLYADATGLSVSVPEAVDATLLGAAMAAATGAGLHPDLATAAQAMAGTRRVREPDPAARAWLDRAHRALRAMARHRSELEGLA